MKILLHVCCAQCWLKALNGLQHEPELECTALWFNPNIHPLIEYRRRLKSVQLIAERLNLPAIIEDGYGLGDFCRKTAQSQLPPGRCAICYRLRFEKVALIAAKNGFQAFSSTLCTSLHQSHQLVMKTAQEAAGKYGVEFIYRDWRECQPEAGSAQGIYKQQYCGCIFSEEERFSSTNLHLFKPSR